MSIGNNLKAIAVVVLAHFTFAFNSFAENFTTVDLWPEGKMPGARASENEVSWGGAEDLYFGNVSTPTLEIHKADAGKKTGLVIISPGGAYQGLAYGKEGREIAEFLRKNGISAAVLKYRVPFNREGALMDIQRAIRYARANAEKLDIYPDKIAVMGFSAGANLSARASTVYENAYEYIDAVDDNLIYPNFTALIYPAYCDDPMFQANWGDKSPVKSADYNHDYKPAEELEISQRTPPAFIVETQQDPYVNSALAYYLALKKAGVSANMHLFAEGEHGYGIRVKDLPVRQWADLCIEWLKYNGFSERKQ